jgi:multidrug efflux pump subunit AcrA (membrane-fusion protein)
VEIEISNNPDNALKAGMYGTASFTSSDRESEKILVAPRNAFLGSVSSNQVFVAEDGVAKLTGVTAGRIFGDKVEILDGLDSNELVIVTGQINLQNGSKIDIID